MSLAQMTHDMATQAPTRRAVLSSLDVNTPISRGSGKSPRSNAGGAEKSRKLAQETSLPMPLPKTLADATTEVAVGSAKRGGDVAVHLEQSPNKRLKTSYGVEECVGEDGAVSTMEKNLLDSSRNAESLYAQAATLPGSNNDSSPSPASSPTSSCNSSLIAVTDSQNTTITEPDDPNDVAVFQLLTQPAQAPMSREQVRLKARAIKLRLGLAGYKVRTNQIELPIERLVIKSPSPNPPCVPRIPTLASTLQRRTPLPSGSTAVRTNIELRRPSSQRDASNSSIPSSPPRSYSSGSPDANTKSTSVAKETEDVTHECFTTPLLPRQRHGMLNPPNFGSPPASELTSSVVKGRAANGLLSLRHGG